MSTNPDVVVIGGGPAGASAARLLARHGHAVTLLTRSPSRHALAESLPPSCLRLFDRMGIASAVEQAGFLRSRGNTVCWGDGSVRIEEFPGNETGLQVRRDTFDQILLDLAELANVNVQLRTAVRQVKVRTEEPEVVYVTGGDTATIHPAWVLDCSGRAGVIGRQVRRPDDERSTVALVGLWEQASPRGETDGNHTVIESYGDGWAWSVPTNRNDRYVTFMVDRSHTNLERSGALSAMYHAELSKTRHVRDLLADAALSEDPWACGAATYGATQYALGRCLLVGDAGSFIDPLSSYGVKKALASAWVAAAVVHTCLDNVSMQAAATQLYQDREHEIHRRLREFTARQYDIVADSKPHPFWTSRAMRDLVEDGTADEPDVAELRNDPDVLAAFQALRKAPQIELRLTARVERVQRAGMAVDHVIMEERLACPWIPSGIRYLRGVDMVGLADLAPLYRQVPDLFEAYNRKHTPASLPDVLGAISVMIAKGMLRNHGG